MSSGTGASSATARGGGEGHGAVLHGRLPGGFERFGEAARAARFRKRPPKASGVAGQARLQGGHGLVGDAGGRAIGGARQRMAHARHDQAAHQAGIAEAHLGLGRMHVDIDLFGPAGQEQRHHRDGGHARQRSA
jgi:hypothetical protein